MFVDWRNQAGDMVWLLAERDDETRGAAFGLVGWHTPPHRAIGAALVAPDERGAGVGIALLDALEGWAATTAAPSSKGPWRRTTRAASVGRSATAIRRPAATPASSSI